MPDSRAHYVALGDSISIDDYAGGPGRGGASLLHRNRDDDFPEWRGRDLLTEDADTAFSLLAADGATTRTLLDVQLPRLAADRSRPTLVTLTIGGNDLLMTYGNTPGAREVILRVRAAVDRALTEITGFLSGTGRIVVGTVYDPSDGTGDAARMALPPWPDGVAVIGALNEALGEAAAEHGAVIADIAGQFHGHGLLAGDPSRHESRPADRSMWFCDVIEPNAWGASGVRAAFWAALHDGSADPRTVGQDVGHVGVDQPGGCAAGRGVLACAP
jgi:lysophospholipase L1-like esterase